jgi:hypothetical protein
MFTNTLQNDKVKIEFTDLGNFDTLTNSLIQGRGNTVNSHNPFSFSFDIETEGLMLRFDGYKELSKDLHLAGVRRAIKTLLIAYLKETNVI